MTKAKMKKGEWRLKLQVPESFNGQKSCYDLGKSGLVRLRILMIFVQ